MHDGRPHAKGRRLGLNEVNVELDGMGQIVVDRYYRTTTAGIYAVGDVTGPALASTAAQHGRVAACHALGLVFGTNIDSLVSSTVYGVPEIATVGATEQELQAAGVPYTVGRSDLGGTARGAIAGRGGLLKLIFRSDNRRLLGIHCVGDIASELIELGHLAIHSGAAVDVFLTLALSTPTYCEAYREAAIDGLVGLAEIQGKPEPSIGGVTALAPGSLSPRPSPPPMEFRS
jgi:NAD(P) transhydrogenase